MFTHVSTKTSATNAGITIDSDSRSVNGLSLDATGGGCAAALPGSDGDKNCQIAKNMTMSTTQRTSTLERLAAVWGTDSCFEPACWPKTGGGAAISSVRAACAVSWTYAAASGAIFATQSSRSGSSRGSVGRAGSR